MKYQSSCVAQGTPITKNYMIVQWPWNPSAIVWRIARGSMAMTSMAQDHHTRCVRMVKAVEVRVITSMGTMMVEASTNITREMATTTMATIVTITTALGKEIATTMEATMATTTTMVAAL